MLYHFPDSNTSWNYPAGPWTSLTATQGAYGEKNFYGTTTGDGSYGRGSIFSWTYNSSGGWQYSTLWNFGGVQNDGAYPMSGVAFNANDGYVYVTTQGGGTQAMGTVFRITP
ncbi:MAG: choice-of-anchor tandem repeat GloVer-containing protein [Candidatus Korobacteraceae bacterium]